MSVGATCAAREPPNKQLQRTVIRRRWRAASAPLHYALAACFKRQRAAAELRRSATHEGGVVVWPGVVLALLIASFASAQRADAPVWDGQSLPITVEALHDVPVKTTERRPDGSYGQQRGTLYSHTSFRINKGQRFQMVAMLGEGSCRIEFQGAPYELSSCPWTPGFTDQQADVFRIVAFDNR